MYENTDLNINLKQIYIGLPYKTQSKYVIIRHRSLYLSIAIKVFCCGFSSFSSFSSSSFSSSSFSSEEEKEEKKNQQSASLDYNNYISY